MKKKFLVSILFLLVIGFYSCKDDCMDRTNPDCSNYDPCHNHKAANADFFIYETIGEGKNLYLSETDTICRSNGVTFRAKNVNENFTWLLGSERLASSEIYRENFPEGWIDVTLISEVPAHSCLKSNQLIDTVHKKFYVLPCTDPRDTNVIMNNPWWGTWEGYNTDAPNDKFLFTFGWINEYGRASISSAGLPKGLPKQIPFYSRSFPVCSGVGGPWGYKVILFKESGNFNSENGFGIQGICKRESNEITFVYKYNDRPYQSWLKGEKEEVEPIQWVHKTFIGKKISTKVVTQ